MLYCENLYIMIQLWHIKSKIGIKDAVLEWSGSYGIRIIKVRNIHIGG